MLVGTTVFAGPRNSWRHASLERMCRLRPRAAFGTWQWRNWVRLLHIKEEMMALVWVLLETAPFFTICIPDRRYWKNQLLLLCLQEWKPLTRPPKGRSVGDYKNKTRRREPRQTSSPFLLFVAVGQHSIPQSHSSLGFIVKEQEGIRHRILDPEGSNNVVIIMTRMARTTRGSTSCKSTLQTCINTRQVVQNLSVLFTSWIQASCS